jgi:alpha-glutamyl/putrescinyl thymine pyrophosphorylase clade 1
MFERRLAGGPAPWTSDPILRTFRFTNCFRVLDRVSQYLIREVQYHPDRSSSAAEVFFRTMLFKIFNKIETWERVEAALGPISWQSTDFDKISMVMSDLMARGRKIYSAAYIMPSPQLGHARRN